MYPQVELVEAALQFADGTFSTSAGSHPKVSDIFEKGTFWGMEGARGSGGGGAKGDRPEGAKLGGSGIGGGGQRGMG